MTRDDIHTCSYSCERPACIKAQRDELAQRLSELVALAVAAERERCCKIVYGMAGSDNVAQRTVEKIRARVT